MKKPIYLGLSISDLSKAVMYEFWYDYVKILPKNNFVTWIQTASLFI